MKKVLVLALLLLLPALSAAGAPDQFIAEKHPDMDIVLSAEDAAGGLAAWVLKKDGELLLSVARKEKDGWRVVSEGKNALLAGREPSGLLVESDAVIWRYRDGPSLLEYHAAYEGGRVAVRHFSREWTYQNEFDRTVISRTDIRHENGFVRRGEHLRDGKGNPIGGELYTMTVPGAEQTDFLLENFLAESGDWEEWMPANEEYNWWPGNEHLRAAARYFCPDAEYLGGGVKEGLHSRAMMQLLVKKKNGDTVLLCAADNGRENDGCPRYALWESAPLPEGAEYGVENFTTSLFFPGCAGWALDVDFLGHIPGVSCVYTDNGTLKLGMNRIKSVEGNRTAYGFHPWADIQTVDWLSLPGGYEDALQKLDMKDWAAVNNPDPKDRLHLRARPDKESASLGKFYNGTPVRVLQRKAGWAEVSVGGNGSFTGWMMEKYLAFGKKSARVESAFPTLDMAERLDEITLYTDIKMKGNGFRLPRDASNFEVVGLVEGESYIIMTWEGHMGYVPQKNLWPGNG